MDKQRIKLFLDTVKKKGNEYFIEFIVWRKYRTARYHGLSRWGKVGNNIMTFCGFFLLYLALVDINFLWLFGKSPSLLSINNPPQLISSEIISSDGQIIGKYFDENRKLVKYENLSPALVNTLVSTEDIRFYRHFGIDIEGLFAAFKDALHGNARGASTITQQLVKNMYKTRSRHSTGLLGYVPGLRLLIEKTKEWTGAIKIELLHAKKECITMYLNTVYFSSNAYGIHTAAKTYYGTTPDKLTYEQSAVLVGMLKAVTVYNPYLNAERAKERRNVVLQQLADNEFITQRRADSLKKSPIILNHTEKLYEGTAPYFRDYLAKFLEKWSEDNGYDIYADGLKIYVTIDSRLQKYAEEAVQKQMKQIQGRFSQYLPANNRNHENAKYLSDLQTVKVFDYSKEGYKKLRITKAEFDRYMNQFLHCGFVAMEPDTKHVKAWVGDVSYDFWQYDKVAQSKRQPGSTFKLFVYTAAMIAGKSPCDKFVDEPFVYKYDGGVWQPKNANGEYGGYPITLKTAFAQSVNSVAAQVAREVGISNVAKSAYMLGIQSKLVEVPSLSLGSSEVSLLELVNAYTTIVSEGMYHSPVIVSRIEDNSGKIIYEANTKPKRVISYENAFLMTELLKGGFTEPGGTSRALWNWDLFRWNTDFGGKTGTTSNNSDAWYVGVTPKLIGGAWVGAEKQSDQFGSSRLGQGSRAALPVFALFMEKVLADKNFAHYRAKFPAEPKEPIHRAYKCPSFVPPEINEADPLANPPKPEDALDVPKPEMESEENNRPF
ncbi:MAG: transglycosylase domain-containing protein [Smithella sp.]